MKKQKNMDYFLAQMQIFFFFWLGRKTTQNIKVSLSRKSLTDLCLNQWFHFNFFPAPFSTAVSQRFFSNDPYLPASPFTDEIDQDGHVLTVYSFICFFKIIPWWGF